MAPVQHPWVFAFGLLGNVISLLVYLAPLPTFWRVYKKKSTEGFQVLPYVCAIFSAMIWIYYALVKTNAFLLITINCFGCVVETLYIVIFLTYAPKEAKIATFKLLALMNFTGFGLIVVVCSYIARVEIRAHLLGWICVAVAVVVFASPLSVIRTVIRTKSVEFMPFPLSLTLTLSAVIWFMYGLLKKDVYIVLPNVVGFCCGVAQMIMYGVYHNHSKVKPTIDLEMNVPEKIACDTPATVNIESVADQVLPVCSQPKTDGVEEAATGTVSVTEKKEDDIGDEFIPRELHVRPQSSCGADEISMVGPVTAGAVPLVGCVAVN